MTEEQGDRIIRLLEIMNDRLANIEMNSNSTEMLSSESYVIDRIKESIDELNKQFEKLVNRL